MKVRTLINGDIIYAYKAINDPVVLKVASIEVSLKKVGADQIIDR